MSLWTPSGEHEVPRDKPSAGGERGTPNVGQSTGAGAPPEGATSLEDLSPEQRAQVEEMARQMDEARARMLQAPSGAVIGQQALQFYELAALYLSQDPPRLDDASAAIDALAAVVEKLDDRLGDAKDPLQQALNQLQLAFVEQSKASSQA